MKGILITKDTRGNNLVLNNEKIDYMKEVGENKTIVYLSSGRSFEVASDIHSLLDKVT